VSSTDITVLNQILIESRQELFPELSQEDFFEFFAAQQILRDQQLDPDDIQSGIVGGDKSGSDGGIDGFYLLVNGRLIRDTVAAENLRALKQNIQMDLVIMQATTHAGFTLDRITRLKDTIEDIFTLDRNTNDFSERYSDTLISAIERFRTAHRVLASKFPAFNVSYFLVSRGDSEGVAADVRGTAQDLEKNSHTLLATIKRAHLQFVGARGLIELSSKPPKTVFSLKCIDAASSGKDAYVVLVRLAEYFRLISSAKGELLTHLFESNVRDYQGEVSVNDMIRDSLDRPVAGEQFWWLNNGITIVAEKLGGHPKELVIEEPQIVNGLQTSQEIFNYFKAHPESEKTDERELLVRIVGSGDVETHDHIIRATNSQTSIPAASLWATEAIHRDIEKVFRTTGLYYDRRKNSWRRKGTPVAKVVGITELAQAVAAIYLQEPDHARARPARYFQKPYYSTVFNNKFDIGMYSVCAHIRKKAEAHLRAVESDKRHRNNLLFYLCMAVTYLKLQLPKARPATIAAINIDEIDDKLFDAAMEMIRPLYESLGTSDKAAKGPDFAMHLKAAIQAKFMQKVNPKKKGNQ
jgi:hypothetical protein